MTFSYSVQKALHVNLEHPSSFFAKRLPFGIKIHFPAESTKKKSMFSSAFPFISLLCLAVSSSLFHSGMRSVWRGGASLRGQSWSGSDYTESRSEARRQRSARLPQPSHASLHTPNLLPCQERNGPYRDLQVQKGELRSLGLKEQPYSFWTSILTRWLRMTSIDVIRLIMTVPFHQTSCEKCSKERKPTTLNVWILPLVAGH